MIKKVVSILFFMLVIGSIFGNAVAVNVITDKNKTEIKKANDNEAERFLEDWKKAEKNGVHSYQMEEALGKLKTYKDGIEEESETNIDILREIES